MPDLLPAAPRADQNLGRTQQMLEIDTNAVAQRHPLSAKSEESVATGAKKTNGPPLSKARCIVLVLTLTYASFLMILGVQASVIILPTIGRHLNIPESRQQWIVSAYNLSFGCFLLLWGRLADVYGKRLIFLCGSVWITIASLLAPFMPNEIAFDVFRGLQGLGAAAIMPTGLGILGVTFPSDKAKNYAFACFGAGQPLGGAFGNLFGGVLAQYLDWQWVFWIFAMLAFIMTAIAWFVIPEPAPQTEPVNTSKMVDWIGGTLITVGILILLFGLTEGNVVGWQTPWVPTLLAIAILIIATFVFWQYYQEKTGKRRPLMKVSIFKNVGFSAANVIMFLFFAAFNNFLITATYWFQEYQGLSVIQTTLRFVPNGITGHLAISKQPANSPSVTVATITAHTVALLPASLILTFATLAVSVANLLFAIPIPPTTSYWAYAFPAMVLCTSGADTLFPVLTLYTAKTLPLEDQALGGALINAVGQIGRAVGLAIGIAIQTAVTAGERGVDVYKAGKDESAGNKGDHAFMLGLKSMSWFSCGIGIVSLVVVQVFFKGVGRVGGKH